MSACLHVVKVLRSLRINAGLMEDGGENDSQSVPTIVMMNGDISDEEDEEGAPDPETGYILLPMSPSGGEDEENGDEEEVRENSETFSPPTSTREAVPQSVSSTEETSRSSDPPMEECKTNTSTFSCFYMFAKVIIIIILGGIIIIHQMAEAWIIRVHNFLIYRVPFSNSSST